MLSPTLLTTLALASTTLARAVSRRNTTCLTAADLITIAPETASCDGADFPEECATAEAASSIAQSFHSFKIDSFGAQAALVAVMLFESGGFKYKINHYPGVAGQGTRNMQSPAFNQKYADWIVANGEDASITQGSVRAASAQGPAQLLDLINADRWSFASAAWFITTQCDANHVQTLADGSQASFENYLTGCVGTTVTEDRIAGWKKVVALEQWGRTILDSLSRVLGAEAFRVESFGMMHLEKVDFTTNNVTEMVVFHGRIAPSAGCLQFMRHLLNAPIPHAAAPAITPCSSTTTCTTTRPRPRHSQIVRSDHNRIHTRPFTSSLPRHETFWRRLRQSRSASKPASSEHLPLPGFLDDSAGLGSRIVKPSNELKLRCTEFDENGNVTLVNGEFRKSELIQKYSLLPRDLRKIDSSVLPHILVRPSAILINLLHLRCLIKHNRVLVFDVYGSTDSYAQSLFMYDLEGKLRQKQATSVAGSLPYEFRALEAVLISVTSGLESEFEGVREPVVRVLRELEEDIDRDKLRHLLIYSKKLGTFEQKARLVRDAIDDLLEADDDLAAMYLTEKDAGTEREDDNHEEVELLLESYHKVADEIVQVSSNIVSAIRNTEEIVRAILDANRNSLMLLDLKFSIGTLGISAGMFIAALYGMNLENFIEESNLGFFGVTAASTALSVAACWWGLKKLRKVQRLSMWGEGAVAKTNTRSLRGPWSEVEASAGAGAPIDKPLVDVVAGIKRAEGHKLWQSERHRSVHSDAKSPAPSLALRTTR